MKILRWGVEIGAGDSFSSDLLCFNQRFDRLDLYEPNPILFRDLYEKAIKYPNVHAHNFAVSSSTRLERLYNIGYSSYLQSAHSPLCMLCQDTPLNNILQDCSIVTNVFGVQSIMSQTPDILSLTCNGSELAILRTMGVLPRTIIVKYYCQTSVHIDYYNQISNWMREHGYTNRLLNKNQHLTFFHMCFELKCT